jgi:carboxyl-terminal processing protease
MQDNDRALIVGSRTFGKGLVQNVLDLPNETGLTLTAAQYYTPAGRSIQRDYSSGSFYDYFNHKNKIADIDKPQYVAKTVTGRRVYGGDGIAPDIAAETPLLGRAFEDNIAFFAASYEGGVSVSDAELLAAFHKFTGVTSGNDANILRSLRIAVTTAAKGASAGNRVRIANDPAVAAAITEMERSRQLFAKARGKFAAHSSGQ